MSPDALCRLRPCSLAPKLCTLPLCPQCPKGGGKLPPPLGQSGVTLNVLRGGVSKKRHCPKGSKITKTQQTPPLGQSGVTLNVLRGGVIYPPLRTLTKKRQPNVSHCISPPPLRTIGVAPECPKGRVSKTGHCPEGSTITATKLTPPLGHSGMSLAGVVS